MVERDPDFIQSLNWSLSDVRNWRQDFLMTSAGVSVSKTWGGVVSSGDLAVTQNGTPNMSVNIAAGTAYIRGRHGFSQGVYRCHNNAVVNKSIIGASATLKRNDLIVAKIFDNAYDGTGFNKWEIVVLQGMNSSTPIDPAMPSSAVPLARVRVAAGDTAINTADIDDLRVTLGFPGTIATSTKFIEFKNVADYGNREHTGNVDVSLSGTVQTRTVNFPSAFTNTPRIFLTLARDIYMHAFVYDVSPSKFSFAIKNTPGDVGLGSGTARVYWRAVGI